MATTAEPWKNRVSASESEGARKGRQVSGRHSPEAMAGTQNTRPSARREVTGREMRQGLQGMAPRQAGAERMKEGVESRWVLARWQVPEYARGR